MRPPGGRMENHFVEPFENAELANHFWLISFLIHLLGLKSEGIRLKLFAPLCSASSARVSSEHRFSRLCRLNITLIQHIDRVDSTRCDKYKLRLHIMYT